MASKGQRYCMDCGRQRQPREVQCPAPCFGISYSKSVRGNVRPIHVPALPLGGVLAGFADLPPGAVLLLAGPKSIGKTTVALGALQPTDPDGPLPWVRSNEMTPGLYLDYAARIGARIEDAAPPSPRQEPVNLDRPPPVMVPRPRMLGLDVLDELAPELPPQTPAAWLGVPPEGCPGGLILDSISRTGDPVWALAQLIEYCAATGTRAIAISQVNAEGEARGSRTLGHDADVVIDIDAIEGYRRLTISKSRYNPEGARLFRFDNGVPSLPEWKRYYSIEGTFPNYRLVSYPGENCRYAGALVAVDNDDPQAPELPPPPLAVAARKSKLYGGKWTDAPDVADRAAFAAACGIPFVRLDPIASLED